jgi:hypothetical protein
MTNQDTNTTNSNTPLTHDLFQIIIPSKCSSLAPLSLPPPLLASLLYRTSDQATNLANSPDFANPPDSTSPARVASLAESACRACRARRTRSVCCAGGLSLAEAASP